MHARGYWLCRAPATTSCSPHRLLWTSCSVTCPGMEHIPSQQLLSSLPGGLNPRREHGWEGGSLDSSPNCPPKALPLRSQALQGMAPATEVQGSLQQGNQARARQTNKPQPWLSLIYQRDSQQLFPIPAAAGANHREPLCQPSPGDSETPHVRNMRGRASSLRADTRCVQGKKRHPTAPRSHPGCAEAPGGVFRLWPPARSRLSISGVSHDLLLCRPPPSN